MRRALELLAAYDLAGARAILREESDLEKSLARAVDELLRRDALRNVEASALRHELGNALSIARANLEGVTDGVVPATPERLDAIARTLAASSELLEKLRDV